MHWRAIIGNSSTFAKLEVRYLHYNVAGKAPLGSANYSEDDQDFVILGGWHHGDRDMLYPFVDELTRLRPNKPTIIVDALPSHFPGGIYKGTNDYPNASAGYKGGLCVPTNFMANPDINDELRHWVDINRNRTSQQNLFRLELQYLYTHRGDAHAGPIPTGRDCLHYCVAPGILDAMALQTLAMLVTLHP